MNIFRKISAALLFLLPINVWAWGAVGHRIVAEYGASIADPADFAHCHVSAAELTQHTNDPDQIWRRQNIQHPDEARMHFFHVDRQPADWQTRLEAADPKQGLLVYHIVRWFKEAQEARANQDWPKLQERLYGLSHYLGDLTQPLHLFHDYDGVEAGLPGIHSQFETKMVGKYEGPIRSEVQKNLAREGIPVIWTPMDYKNLIFNVAIQSSERAPALLENARSAVQEQRSRKKRSRGKIGLRFVKSTLWEKEGELAVSQITLGARLFANTLNLICR